MLIHLMNITMPFLSARLQYSKLQSNQWQEADDNSLPWPEAIHRRSSPCHLADSAGSLGTYSSQHSPLFMDPYGEVRLMWMAAGTARGLLTMAPSPVGPLTLRFDRVTWPFLNIDMRHEAYQHEKKYY